MGWHRTVCECVLNRSRWSGAPIRPAVESGLLAARSVIEAQGDYRGQRLAPYLEPPRQRYRRGGTLGANIPACSVRHGCRAV
jgi:hypothetical protein